MGRAVRTASIWARLAPRRDSPAMIVRLQRADERAVLFGHDDAVAGLGRHLVERGLIDRIDAVGLRALAVAAQPVIGEHGDDGGKIFAPRLAEAEFAHSTLPLCCGSFSASTSSGTATIDAPGPEHPLWERIRA